MLRQFVGLLGAFRKLGIFFFRKFLGLLLTLAELLKIFIVLLLLRLQRGLELFGSLLLGGDLLSELSFFSFGGSKFCGSFCDALFLF